MASKRVVQTLIQDAMGPVLASNVTLGGNLTIADGKNIVLHTPTGTALGTAAAQKLGFWGATPVVQPSGASQAAASQTQDALTDSSGGAASTTLAALTNLDTITDNVAGTPGTTLAAVAVQRTIVLPVQLADLATGTFKVTVPHAFTVTAAKFRTGKAATTGSKGATLTAQIAGGAVAGGVITLTSANQNTIGALQAGTAITGTNTGTAGQTLEVAASAVTAFVEGDGYVEFTVINNDLANAVSSLTAELAKQKSANTVLNNDAATLAAELAKARTDIAGLITLANALRTALVNTGLIKGNS